MSLGLGSSESPGSSLSIRKIAFQSIRQVSGEKLGSGRIQVLRVIKQLAIAVRLPVAVIPQRHMILGRQILELRKDLRSVICHFLHPAELGRIDKHQGNFIGSTLFNQLFQGLDPAGFDRELDSMRLAGFEFPELPCERSPANQPSFWGSSCPACKC